MSWVVRGMQLLASFDSQEEGEAAEKKVSGKKRLASERDSNVVVWNLFGEATWSNFFQLGMFDLPELKELLEQKKAGQDYSRDRHLQIVSSLGFVESAYGIKVPLHWK